MDFFHKQMRRIKRRLNASSCTDERNKQPVCPEHDVCFSFSCTESNPALCPGTLLILNKKVVSVAFPPDSPAALPHRPSVQTLSAEMESLKRHLSQIDSPTVLCHNDLLTKNIIYNHHEGEQRTSHTHTGRHGVCSQMNTGILEHEKFLLLRCS